MQTRQVTLYHGSDVLVDRPRVALNSGFADLGQGFYLTPDLKAATSRAYLRARRMGTGDGVVSTFEFDERSLPWVVWGERIVAPEGLASPFGLVFEESAAGVVAWANYIVACRQGKSALEGLGEPTVVRAWIATEEIEMVYAGFASAEELGAFLKPKKLVVQYCFRDQAFLDAHLHFCA